MPIHPKKGFYRLGSSSFIEQYPKKLNVKEKVPEKKVETISSQSSFWVNHPLIVKYGRFHVPKPCLRSLPGGGRLLGMKVVSSYVFLRTYYV